MYELTEPEPTRPETTKPDDTPVKPTSQTITANRDNLQPRVQITRSGRTTSVPAKYKD